MTEPSSSTSTPQKYAPFTDPLNTYLYTRAQQCAFDWQQMPASDKNSAPETREEKNESREDSPESVRSFHCLYPGVPNDPYATYVYATLPLPPVSHRLAPSDSKPRERKPDDKDTIFDFHEERSLRTFYYTIAQQHDVQSTYDIYDSWGRLTCRKDNAWPVKTSYYRPLRVDNTSLSPLEMILEKEDTANYHLFLTAYYQLQQQELGKFLKNEAITAHFDEQPLPALILPPDTDADTFKRQSLYEAYTRSKAKIVAHIQEEQSTPLETELAGIHLKNGIAICDNMHLAIITDPETMKILKQECGPSVNVLGWKAGFKDKPLYLSWQKLRQNFRSWQKLHQDFDPTF